MPKKITWTAEMDAAIQAGASAATREGRSVRAALIAVSSELGVGKSTVLHRYYGDRHPQAGNGQTSTASASDDDLEAAADLGSAPLPADTEPAEGSGVDGAPATKQKPGAGDDRLGAEALKDESAGEPDVHEAEVVEVTDFGAYVRMPDGERAFLPAREIAGQAGVIAAAYLFAGQRVHVQIIGENRNDDRARYQVSARRVHPIEPLRHGAPQPAEPEAASRSAESKLPRPAAGKTSPWDRRSGFAT